MQESASNAEFRQAVKKQAEIEGPMQRLDGKICQLLKELAELDPEQAEKLLDSILRRRARYTEAVARVRHGDMLDGERTKRETIKTAKLAVEYHETLKQAHADMLCMKRFAETTAHQSAADGLSLQG
jgi:hypothetical protein